jgi:hypothetical protein
MIPAAVAELAEVAGWDAAWALVRAKGGTTVFLPRRVQSGHWLVEIVGLEAARKICAHYRSSHQMRLTIPMAARRTKRQRWAEVAMREDLSLAETARVMDVHERTVTNWRRRLRNSRQGRLL